MSTIRKNLSLISPYYWPLWLLIGLLWLITRLPYRWQVNFGRLIGKGLYYLPTKVKHITEVNIKLCFPELDSKQQTKLIKKNFESIGIGLIEGIAAWWIPDDKLTCSFHLNGLEHVEQAFAKGKGIILLGPHFTCLEMVGRIIGRKYSFAVMYRPHKKRFIAFFHERFRKSYVQYIPRHQLRKLLRALEQNVAIWYAYDVDGGIKRSVFAPLFGIQTASLTAVSRIVRLSGTAVIPISFCRNDDLSYTVTLSPALENFPSENPVADATRLNAILEEAIRKQPEQYIWQYKRFKTRPAGEARFY